MRIYEATIADLDGLASVFNNYRVFYRQDSDIEEANYFYEIESREKNPLFSWQLKMENISDSRNYIHHFLLFR